MCPPPLTYCVLVLCVVLHDVVSESELFSPVLTVEGKFRTRSECDSVPLHCLA